MPIQFSSNINANKFFESHKFEDPIPYDNFKFQEKVPVNSRFNRFPPKPSFQVSPTPHPVDHPLYLEIKDQIESRQLLHQVQSQKLLKPVQNLDSDQYNIFGFGNNPQSNRNVKSTKIIPSVNQNAFQRMKLKQNFKVTSEPSAQKQVLGGESPEQLYEQYMRKKENFRKLHEKVKKLETDPKNIVSRKQELSQLQKENSSELQTNMVLQGEQRTIEEDIGRMRKEVIHLEMNIAKIPSQNSSQTEVKRKLIEEIQSL